LGHVQTRGQEWPRKTPAERERAKGGEWVAAAAQALGIEGRGARASEAVAAAT